MGLVVIIGGYGVYLMWGVACAVAHATLGSIVVYMLAGALITRDISEKQCLLFNAVRALISVARDGAAVHPPAVAEREREKETENEKEKE
jgi:ribosomal protein L12E/L44/L45/RPP1/RPP2